MKALEHTSALRLVQARGTLQLIHPSPGESVFFDADEYTRIDFRLILGDWKSLHQTGSSLVILFGDGAVIELSRFFDDSEFSNRPLAQVDDSTYLSPALFFQRYAAADDSLNSLQNETNQTISSGMYSAGAPTPLPLLTNETRSFSGIPNENSDLSLPTIPPAAIPLPSPILPPTPPNNPPKFELLSGAMDVTEDSPPFIKTRTIAFTDSDLSDSHTVSVVPTGAGYLGSFTASVNNDSTGNGAGQVTEIFSVDDTALQFLSQGQSLVQSYIVVLNDGAGGTDAHAETVAITGVNDAPMITGAVVTGNVTEGALPIMTAIGTIDFADVDLADAHITSVMPQGSGYLGIFSASVNDDSTGGGSGQVTWLFAATNQLHQSLGAGQQFVQIYSVEIDDGHGGTQSQLVTITIDGTNDAAVITGDTAGTVVEAGGVANGTPGTPTATGDLGSIDVDDPNDAWTVVTSPVASDNGFGAYTLSSTGVWTFTLDNNNPAAQSLNVGDTLTDTFTVATVDGTSQVVTITIDGANDAAIITGNAAGTVIEAGGIANGTPETPTANGKLTDTDADNAANTFQTVPAGTTSTGGFGTFAVTAVGVWTYTLDNTNSSVQAINVGGTLTDTFSIATADGTTQMVSITINGSNDVAVISGTTSGAVIEAGGVANGTPGTPTATGDLNSTDVDNANDSWTAVSSPTASINGYGAFTLTNAGVWTYALDNTKSSVQALNVGGTLTDTFTVATADGTTQLVSIAINGRNDAAVISGTSAGSVIEAGGIANATPGTPTTTGDLNAADLDNPNDAWTSVGSPSASNNGYGTYTLSSAGIWNYTLDNNNAAVQALNAGGTLTDSFTVVTVDGTSQVVTITISGANDAAVIAGGTTGAAVEAGGVANGTSGTQTATGDLNASDVDNPSDTWIAVASPFVSGNGYGIYTLSNTGVWTYTLDDDNAAVQALNVGGTLTDTFNAVTVDGTSQVVTITINGTNDAATINGDTIGFTTTNGSAPVTGDLNATDVDNANDTWNAVSSPSASDHGYGTFTIDASGHWNYTLDINNPVVRGLGTGDLVDTFTVTTVDGTPQQVTVLIEDQADSGFIKSDPSPYYAFANDAQSPNSILADLTDIISGGVSPVTYTLDLNSPTNAASWAWLDQSAIPIVSSSAATITNGLAGTYTALVEAGDANGNRGLSGVAFTLLANNASEFDITIDSSGSGAGERNSGNRSVGDLIIVNDGITGLVNAGGGDDVMWIRAGIGTHSLDGGGGNDALYGNNGNDHLDGGNGNNFLSGGVGQDVLIGGGGDDILLGGDGGDNLNGGGGNNVLFGGAGGDALTGGSGTDVIFGEDGDDLLSGGGGADLLDGGSGNDFISGDGGNDVIIGGLGTDTLTAVGGAVRFIYSDSGPSNVDTITDYRASNGDVIDVSNLVDANFGVGSVVSDFVRLVQTGSNITAQVDTDGPAGGATWSDVAILSNYGTPSADLVNIFFEGQSHSLTV